MSTCQRQKEALGRRNAKKAKLEARTQPETTGGDFFCLDARERLPVAPEGLKRYEGRPISPTPGANASATESELEPEPTTRPEQPRDGKQ